MDAAILIRDLEPFSAGEAGMGSCGRDDPDRGRDRQARRRRRSDAAAARSARPRELVESSTLKAGAARSALGTS